MIRPTSAPRARRRAPAAALALGLCLSFVAACYTGPGNVFTRLTEARRLAADLRVQFDRAKDASNRAVMALTDEDAVAFAREAEQALQAVHRDMDALRPLFEGLRSTDAARALDEFGGHLATYEAVDRSVRELVVESSNRKAQEISFGPARAAADALRADLDAVAAAAPAKARCRVESLVAGAALAVREIQVLQGPHIAEAKDAEMTRLEKEMDERAAAARRGLADLAAIGEPGSRERLAAATAALGRFLETNKQIIALSRRNSNVRSLGLSLREKRPLVAACEGSLSALQDALAKEETNPSR